MTGKTWILAAVCLTAGLGAFVATLVARPPATTQGGSAEALDIPARVWTRAVELDPTFPAESRALAAELQRERAALADLLAGGTADDEAVLAQVERVIAADNALERRSARHLLKIRTRLSPDQQKQLMGVVSEAVRHHGGPRWRGGRGADAATATQPAPPPPGRRRQGRE